VSKDRKSSSSSRRGGASEPPFNEERSQHEPSGEPSAELTAELFERAVRQHSRRLLAIARAIVGTRAAPEDVVQQAVMNLYQHRHRYDWREPGGLLKRAVVNEALRLLRHPRMTMVADDHPTDRPSGGVDEMIEDETVRQVRAAIARLPDHFRAALVLCEYENLSYVEIAQALGASVPQVKTWLHRARRQLAEMLKNYVKVR
jgi:RNA polymerase sigma-70 factor (ECF subfamily)